MAVARMSARRYRQRAAEIVARLRYEVGGFGPEAPPRSQRLARAEADPFYFFRTYLPHYFHCDFAPFHYELVELLAPRPSEVVPVVVAAPRGFAKTTIVSFGYVLHQMLFAKRKFIILGSDTADLAGDLVGYITLELTHNQRIISDFGRRAHTTGSAGDITAGSGTRVLARGSGQRIRGLKHGVHRPDLVVLDDLENDINVRNPRIVRHILEWITSAVYPALAPGGNLFIIGTLISRRSALATMVHSSEEPYCHFVRRVYKAITDEGESLWPARYPLEALLKQKQLMGSAAFYREKLNDPRDEQGLFRQEWIRTYHTRELEGKALVVAGFLDPSLAEGESGDFKAVVSVGLDPEEGVLYVLDAFIRRCSLEQLVRAVILRHRRLGYHVFGVEDNLFQRLLLEHFARAAREEGVILPLKGVTQRLPKHVRLSGISPLVERGLVRFSPEQGDQQELIEQLLHFPSPNVHDDGPDALEGAISLLKGGAPRVW